MRIKKFLRMVLVVLMISGFTSLLSAAVIVKDTGWLWDKDENNDCRGDLGKIQQMEKGSKSYFSRSIYFDTGKRKLYLWYETCNDPSHLMSGQEYHSHRGLGGVGIGVSAGWHPGGSIDILVNGVTLGNYKPEITSESKGEEAEAIYTWDTSEARIKMTFTAKNGDDKFFLKVDIEPKKEISSIKTSFLCYPSSYGKFTCVKQNYPELMNKRDRWISTPRREIQHTRKVILEKEEFWILYYDKIWDKAKREKCCAGPCALLFLPNEPEEIVVDLGNYAVRTYFTYSPITREMNYIIWPSMGISNEEALKKMKELKLEK